MSRLIDADELIQELKKNKTLYTDEYEEGRNTGISWCIEDVVNAPIVKAITIEWINNWLNTGRNAKYFIPMMKMVEDWEKENERV